jgi:lipopolysaccharide export system protein LptA
VAVILFASDISAPKMEIVETPQGRATVFPQGIVITDKNTKIIGKNAIFYERENKAKVYDSLLITTPQLSITADTAYYDFDAKTTMLKGNVIVESETLLINTSIMTFEQGKNLVKAHNDVSIREKLQNIKIISQTGEYNFSDAIGIVDSYPTLYIERSDTTVIKSGKMILMNRESQFLAIDSVSAQTNTSILKCDTLLFYIQEDSGFALGNPMVLDKDNHLTGKSIRFYFFSDDSTVDIKDQSSLKTVKVSDNAQAKYLTDDGGTVQVFGSNMSINYKDGEVNNVWIYSDSLNLVSGNYVSKKEF